MTQTKNKVVIITGAARGIGLAFAERLAKDNYIVVIFDLHGAQEAAESIQAKGGQALAYNGNVTSEADWDALLNHLSRLPYKIYGLVNNAAMFASLEMQAFQEVDKETWQKVMEINTFGPFLATQKVFPYLKEEGGSIVNVASTSPLKGVTGMMHYVASKGAVLALTKSLARELGEYNIRVNTIAPGFTLSDSILKNTKHVNKFREIGKASRSLKRDQSPQDLIGALSFLIGSDSQFMTGQTLIIDGGAHFI